MDFPLRLRTILSDQDGRMMSTTTIDSQALQAWNTDIETFLSSTPPSSSHLSQQAVDGQELMICIRNDASLVHGGIVRAIVRDSTHSDVIANDDSTDITSLTYLSKKAKDELSLHKCPVDEHCLFLFVRIAKNLLRWYIQIYLEWRHIPNHGEDDNRYTVNNPMESLQSPEMLDLMLNILKWSIDTNNRKVDNSRFASLYLFYATYSPNPNDSVTQTGMNYLVQELSFPKVSLKLLCQIDSIALALSLIRNLHNLAVSCSGAAKIILSTTISATELFSMRKKSPWLSEDNLDGHSPLSFVSINSSIVLWCLQQSNPTSFPGSDDDDDKRSELVVEILNAFYSLRIGPQLKQQTDESNLACIVLEILQLSPPKGIASNDIISVKRIQQCKVATCPLLMDSDPSFLSVLFNNGAIPSLLHILEQQVEDVVDNSRVDSSATASLVPILTVLRKYAIADSRIQKQIHEFVFPPDAEDNFQEKVRQLQHESSSYNMSPLDAPPQTLRWKLIKLLSWPESHIKRCAAELLWTLSNSSAIEYVHRVGMGNAMPLLNAKGLASLPVPST